MVLMILYVLSYFIIGTEIGLILRLMSMIVTTTQDIKNLAESFQAICIGLGSLAVFFATLIKTVSWFNYKKRVNYYQKLYPVTELDTSFKLVYQPTRVETNKQIYLIDMRGKTKIKHYISNPSTLLDLGFYTQFVDVNYLKTDFDDIPEKEPINTKKDDVFTIL